MATSVDVPYSLASASTGRIVVRGVSPAFGGDVHRASVEVTLETAEAITSEGGSMAALPGPVYRALGNNLALCLEIVYL